MEKKTSTAARSTVALLDFPFTAACGPQLPPCPNSLRIFYSLLWSTVKGFGIGNKAEIDVFLELSCFFDDPADVGNLISGSSAFSKTSLNILKMWYAEHSLKMWYAENYVTIIK